jgi:hypothetical protein
MRNKRGAAWTCSKIRLGTSQVPVDPVVGCLYGTLFTLSPDGRSLVKTEQ